MCMIAYRPIKGSSVGGSNIPNDVIATAMTRHPDGFGLAFRDETGLQSLRFGPSEREAFKIALKEVDRRSVEYVAHFRWATHGPRAESHAHPFEYIDPDGERVLVFHNGIISIMTTPAQSDTEVFVHTVLAQLPSRWWANPALVYLVKEALIGNKIVIMTATETVNLMDEDGSWDGGIWYSSEHRSMAAPTAGWRAQGSYADDDDDYQPYVGSRGSAWETGGTIAGGNLTSGGHKVVLVDDIPRNIHDGKMIDGSYEQALLCDVCYTIGSLHVYDGEVYIDLPHRPDRFDSAFSTVNEAIALQLAAGATA